MFIDYGHHYFRKCLNIWNILVLASSHDNMQMNVIYKIKNPNLPRKTKTYVRTMKNVF